MTGRFIFWAQALDNSSPDHIDVWGEQLSADDTERRQEAVSLVSSVVKSGTRIFSSGNVLLTADARRFVVEVPSAERDRAGRTAPLVCCGNYDAPALDELGTLVVAGLDDFGRRIGRSIQPENFALARESFRALKKKSSMRKLVRVVGLGAVALVLLALAYGLVSRGS